MTDIGRVADYMTRDLITLLPETEINRAMNLLLNKRISGAPVLDGDGNLIGVLSKKDCLKAALEASYYRDWGRTVASYMSTKIETVDAGMDIVAVTDLFVNSAFRRFPVLENGKLVGQISRADALRAMNDNWV